MGEQIEPRRAGEGGDLVVRGVSMQYGNVVALRGVDLVVRRGSITALLGANGAGKTSLLRAISGNTRPHRARVTGSIRWRGAELVGSSPSRTVRAGVAQVPEGRRVFAGMSVNDNLRTGHSSGAGSARSSLERIYALFPVLAERRHQHAGLLSGGEQQMLAIGRALMTRPRMLMLDEPSLGLAPKMVGRIMEVIRDVHSDGTSILLIEQNAAMAVELADEATVLELGSVAHSGSTSDPELRSRIRSLYLSGESDLVVASSVARPPLAPWHDPRTERIR